jgi:hypothetical protein
MFVLSISKNDSERNDRWRGVILPQRVGDSFVLPVENQFQLLFSLWLIIRWMTKKNAKLFFEIGEAMSWGTPWFQQIYR